MAQAPTQPAPKQPGDRLASYFENFFRTVVGISTFGASITFSKIVSSPTPPFDYYGFSAREVQYLLATSWLLFVLALAFTSFFASALSLWRPQAVAAFGTTTGKDRVKVLWFASAVSALLFGMVIAAFVMLALVVVAYVGPVGWVAVGFTVLFGVLGFGAVLWQSPVEWPGWVMGVEREERDKFQKHFLPKTSPEKGRQGVSQLPRTPSGPPPRQRMVERGSSAGVIGRSISGDRAGRDRSNGRYDDGYNVDRYSKASTIVSDVYEPGRFGQRGMIMYDDGVREGIVMGRYAS